MTGSGISLGYVGWWCEGCLVGYWRCLGGCDERREAMEFLGLGRGREVIEGGGYVGEAEREAMRFRSGTMH